MCKADNLYTHNPSTSVTNRRSLINVDGRATKNDGAFVAVTVAAHGLLFAVRNKVSSLH